MARSELVDLYNKVGDVLRDERCAILQREMLLETVFEATPMAIVLVNARDRVIFANCKAREGGGTAVVCWVPG